MRNASVLALIIAAARVVVQTCGRAGERLCTTSWSSDRGFLVRSREGSRVDRIIAAIALDSVAGTLASGLIVTSNVAFEGSSAARRTSIGPERDANAVVSPLVSEVAAHAPRSFAGYFVSRTERKSRRTIYTSQAVEGYLCLP